MIAEMAIMSAMDAKVGDKVWFKKGSKLELGWVMEIDRDAQTLRVRVVRDLVTLPFSEVLKVDPQKVREPRRLTFEPGMDVRIIDGPFNGFEAVVDTVDNERKELRAVIRIASRSQTVDLTFSQVEKR